eukprot:jgi/Hompol1/6266/HPOL_000317-RA
MNILCAVAVMAVSALGHPLDERIQQPLAISSPQTQGSSYQPGDAGRFLHITDIHLDNYYKPGSTFASQCHAKPSSKKKSAVAGIYGSPGAGCDSPAVLVDETFRFIKEELLPAGLDFVFWTGDNVRHSDTAIPRTEPEIQHVNKIITQHMISTLSHPSDPSTPLIPILASIGNNDIHPHNRLKYSRKSLNPTLNFFADLWAPIIPRSQDTIFRRIGSYYIELIPNKLWGVSLNTLYLASNNDAVPDCRRRKQKLFDYGSGPYPNTRPDERSSDGDTRTTATASNSRNEFSREYDDQEEFAQKLTAGDDVLSWLELDVLIPAKNRNISVYLSGHIPPNVINYGTGCFAEFSRLTVKYRSVIRGQFYGHMNIGMYLVLHFKVVQSDEDVPYPVFVAPSVTPVFNPALRVYHYSLIEQSNAQDSSANASSAQPERPATFVGSLTDYDQYYADLKKWN